MHHTCNSFGKMVGTATDFKIGIVLSHFSTTPLFILNIASYNYHYIKIYQ